MRRTLSMCSRRPQALGPVPAEEARGTSRRLSGTARHRGSPQCRPVGTDQSSRHQRCELLQLVVAFRKAHSMCTCMCQVPDRAHHKTSDTHPKAVAEARCTSRRLSGTARHRGSPQCRPVGTDQSSRHQRCELLQLVVAFRKAHSMCTCMCQVPDRAHHKTSDTHPTEVVAAAQVHCTAPCP